MRLWRRFESPKASIRFLRVFDVAHHSFYARLSSTALPVGDVLPDHRHTITATYQQSPTTTGLCHDEEGCPPPHSLAYHRELIMRKGCLQMKVSGAHLQVQKFFWDRISPFGALFHAVDVLPPAFVAAVHPPVSPEAAFRGALRPWPFCPFQT